MVPVLLCWKRWRCWPGGCKTLYRKSKSPAIIPALKDGVFTRASDKGSVGADNLLKMYQRLVARQNARGALVVLSHRYPSGVFDQAERPELEKGLEAIAGAPVDLVSLETQYARGWKVWQPSGLKGAVRRFLKANPTWGKTSALAAKA